MFAAKFFDDSQQNNLLMEAESKGNKSKKGNRNKSDGNGI